VLLAALSIPLLGGENGSAPTLQTAAPPAPSEEALFGELPVVEAAALRVQTLKEAPANVTVVTATEIHRYGYRTLAEVLDSVRGFYVSYDHMYRYVGVRGLSLPGDFNTRFLVMINGHPLTENVYNSNGFFGQDFGFDMELIERIEIIRGPTSALYGSNGILANINIVTKSPVDQPRVRVSMESGNFGEKKAGFATSPYLGKGVNLILSASVFDTTGHSLFLPNYGDPQAAGAVAHNIDAENGYHSFAQLLWGNWSATAYFNSRRILQTNGLYNSDFNNTGNAVLDQRNFVSVEYSRRIGVDRRFRWRTSYDQYRYRDVFLYPLENEESGLKDLRDHNWGDWVTSQVSWSTPVRRLGILTVGGEGYQEFRNLQKVFQTTPVFEQQLVISRPNRGFALFAQQEIKLSPKWKVDAGLREDYSLKFAWFTAPRVALIFDQNKATTYKLSYARAFRNPSTYEKYYDDGFYQISNADLREERTHAFELSADRRLGKRFSAVIDGFYYRMDDVIQSQLLGEVLQYGNTGQIRIAGVDTELTGSPFGWLEASASAAFQHTIDESAAERLPNSPSMLTKARIGVPVARRRGLVHFAVRGWNSRHTGAGEELPPVVLFDTGFTIKARAGFEMAAGVRNLFNRIYDDPVDLTLDRIRVNGRTWFLRMSWRSDE
jgi:iron complex outermembrane receptor protein